MPEKYGYFGDYSSWEDAQLDSSGYNSEIIFKKVKKSLLKVKNGEAAYERDSVIFDKIQYSWPLLSSLLWIASQNNNKLSIADFGGSLGSSYYQNISFLNHLTELKWNIIEQDKFYEIGKELFENESLKFYNTLEECYKKNNINTILLSSSLQYLEIPYELINTIMELEIDYVIIDRLDATNEDRDILKVQKVPPEIYEASIPVWFMSSKKLIRTLQSKYCLITDFDSMDAGSHIEKGFIFKRKGI